MDSTENKVDEKRKFPRITAESPILYREKNSTRWILGNLIDLSATGLAMISNENFSENSEFEFQIKAGKNKSIPEFRGEGIILRCIDQKNKQFLLSCKLLKIKPEK